MSLLGGMVGAHTESLARRNEILVAKVHPLGFDTIVVTKGGGNRVVAEFRIKRESWKHIEVCIWFDYRNHQEREEWRCHNPINRWEGPVCDTPDAAYVAAALENWGRTSEERDYSQSSEV
ncbi:hypothetical protein [Pseudomonas mediterranea]|uniref:hypothetical protein n=1 Tax=Pseudomonas mediterranea TaxID=183795 RepID=UPI0006D8954C|nr:hypothetical protein [Pseudomonas mediterranea]